MSVSAPSAGNVFLGIQQAPLYINGCQVQWASTTTLTVSAGQALDASGASNIILDAGVTIDCANVGLNGIDTGALAVSSNYYVYLLGKSTDKTAVYQGAIVSLSATGPALPAGFDCWRLLDGQKTDGSSHFLKNINYGNGNKRTKYWDAAISVLSGGTSVSLAAVDLSPALFAVFGAVPVTFNALYTPATAGDRVSIAPYGSTSTSLPALSSVVAAQVQRGQLIQMCALNAGVPNILYINSASSGSASLLVNSFDYEI